MTDSLKEVDRKRISAYIEKEVGIQLPKSKHSLVKTRLRKRQRKLGMPTLSEYIDYALAEVEGEDERLHMVDALTTNKTDFYREPYHFEFLAEQITRMHKQKPWTDTRPFTIWSAGCSTGEEPYTMAMELSELQRVLHDFDFQVIATDISVSCLQTAKRAIYLHERVEPVDIALRKRYLMRGRNAQEKMVQVAPEVRAKVDFQFFNLLASQYDGFKTRFDVIFCRNVMIYFNNSDRNFIIQNFARCLKKNGILFIGHSESLPENSDIFKRIRPTIYQIN